VPPPELKSKGEATIPRIKPITADRAIKATKDKIRMKRSVEISTLNDRDELLFFAVLATGSDLIDN
jgi:hypothetical protein